MGFDGKMVMLAGQIKLIVVTKGKRMMVNFIVVHVSRPWIHVMGAVLSTLH